MKMENFLNNLKKLSNVDDNLDVNASEEEILGIFKNIVISRKIEEPDHLNLFLNLISWYSSKLNKPQDTFVLEIFNADDELEIWDKVAFANAIQVPFRDPYQKPTREDFDTVEPAIQEYLNILKPDKMIVFSKRVWNDGLKSDINWGEHVGDIEENNKKSTVWKFNYENGFCHGIGINHASSRGFSPQNWKPLIDKFLNEQY